MQPGSQIDVLNSVLHARNAHADVLPALRASCLSSYRLQLTWGASASLAEHARQPTAGTGLALLQAHLACRRTGHAPLCGLTVGAAGCAIAHLRGRTKLGALDYSRAPGTGGKARLVARPSSSLQPRTPWTVCTFVCDEHDVPHGVLQPQFTPLRIGVAGRWAQPRQRGLRPDGRESGPHPSGERCEALWTY